MALLDFLFVAAFFLSVFLIGIIERKKITIDDYWVNSRKTNKHVLVATVLSTYMGVAAILGVAGITYEGAGLAALTIVASFFFYFFIFARFFAPKMKEFADREKAYTLPDFLEYRYSKAVRVAGALVNLVTYGLFLALQIVGMGVFVSSLAGLDATLATFIGGAIVIIYTTIGGLRADIRTDVFQFFIMLSLLLIFLPALVIKAGGLGPIFSLPTSFLIGTEFAPPYVFVAVFFFLGASVMTSPELWQRVYASDTTKNVRWAMSISGILVLLFLIMAVMFGIYGKLLLPSANSNVIVPELLKTTLPMGIFGLVIAGFFAAILASADTILLLVSMTLVHDLYQKSLGRTLSDEKLLKVSRFVTLAVGAMALTIAIIVFNIVHLAIEAVSFFVVLLPAVVFGFYWKEAKAVAAFWSIAVGFVTIVAFLFVDPVQAFIPGIITSFITFLLVNAFVSRTRTDHPK